MTKFQKDPTYAKFFKRGLFKDIKNDISMCQTRKYKNTNMQIHKYTNTAYDEVPERPKMCHIFEKRNDISVCQTIQNTNTKYTNTAYNEVPETPNIWHIFEKRIIQGYHK